MNANNRMLVVDSSTVSILKKTKQTKKNTGLDFIFRRSPASGAALIHKGVISPRTYLSPLDVFPNASEGAHLNVLVCYGGLSQEGSGGCAGFPPTLR